MSKEAAERSDPGGDVMKTDMTVEEKIIGDYSRRVLSAEECVVKLRAVMPEGDAVSKDVVTWKKKVKMLLRDVEVGELLRVLTSDKYRKKGGGL